MIRDIFGGIWVVVDGCDLDESTFPLFTTAGFIQG